MTTFTQLDKFAGKWFNDQMRRRSFAIEKKFFFWRKRGPLFDMFIPQILTGGELLRLEITIWSPWVESLSGEFKSFPPDTCYIGGTLCNEFPERMVSGMLFHIENEEQVEISLQKILTLVDNNALPWFKTVNSYQTYAAYIGDKGYYPTPEFQEKLKVGIARGFENEPLWW